MADFTQAPWHIAIALIIISRTMKPVVTTACRLLVLGLALAAPAAQAQQVTLERDSPLYSEPRLEAAPVAQLGKGSTGEVLGKDGGWLNLRTPGGTGWVFSFNVRFPSQKADGGASPALGRVFGPRRVASGIGVRGLEEEELRQATFDARQMKLLDGYATGREAAERDARAAGLAPFKVDYFDGAP